MGTVVYRQLDEIETVSTVLRLLWSIIASTATTIGASAFAAPVPGVADGAKTQASAARDGQHDFDFNLGTWRTHVKRLLHPLTGSSTWAEYDGTSVVSKVWDGRANLLELEADGPAGRIEGLGLRLYNPESHQWSLNWASSVDGEFQQPPMIGQFVGGRGEFVDHEVFGAKSILSRNAFSDISPDFARFEQAFSDDGGRLWETNWVITFTRIPAGAQAIRTAGSPDHNSPPPTAGATATEHDGQHDFDFAFGTWKTHIMRLKDPLSGSTSWIEYDGTHTIRRVWGGRANLGELEADGPAGHIEAMSPRLYNPRTQLWSVSYGNPHDGILSRPVVGRFKNGHGEFYGQDTFKGRVVLVREIYSPIDSKTRRLEIAYSEDGGRTWETNWRMTDTFVSAAMDTTK
jgi:hypothetical protein